MANVTKLFPSGKRQHSLFRVLKSGASRGGAAREMFAALSSIDLEVKRGDRVALIGNNGSGKSTLLRVVAGLHPPTTGTVEVDGERTLLAGLGVGMVDELKVEQNIYLYGAMHGISRPELRENLDEILRWAELTEFPFAPLKNLSTGMRSRLAFSVTRYFTSSIYLLDEALTAGDQVFREKCDEVFRGYKQNGRTMLIATHDFKFVERHCNKVLWLQRGKRMAFGATAAVLPQYQSEQKERLSLRA
jgi:ABC-type polysaccharide/polyol phosphate transport system ATPase subunit